jgi:hypothetical protein
MKPLPAPALFILALLGACAAPPSAPQSSPGAAGVGAPHFPVNPAVLGAVHGAGPEKAEAIRLPDRITLPAAYRLILLDGHLTLVRETDAQAIAPGPGSLRIVMGELARGELAYQPALLPQELAADVATDRASVAQMKAALEAVMRRSGELSAQVRELEAESRRLADLLAGAPRPAAPPNTGSREKPEPGSGPPE